MNKVIVIGCPGSGKSTFSRKLSNILGILVYHLDVLFWNKDKTNVGREVLIERLLDVFNKDAWIIDGNYGSTMELRIEKCDTIVFLDYPVEVCIEGVKNRQGKLRSDMPYATTEEDDKDFIEFIKNYNEQSRPKVIKLLEKYSQKNIIVFKNRKEADNFLIQLKQHCKH